MRERLTGAAFSANGQYLILRRLAPPRDAREFTWALDAVSTDRNRSRATFFELDNVNAARIVELPHLRGGPVMSPTFSPDGRNVAFVTEQDGRARLGIYDRDTEARRVIDVTPAAYGVRPTWISDREVMLSVTRDERLPTSFTDQVSRLWRNMREGEVPTSSATGTGRYSPDGRNDPDQALVAVELSTGRARRLSRGRFFNVLRAPDRSRLAAIRFAFTAYDPRLPAHTARSSRADLVMIGPDGRDIEIPTCPDCSLLGEGDSVAWSPDSERLAFIVYRRNSPGLDRELWLYETASGVARQLPASQSGLTGRLMWIGNNLALQVQGQRTDWAVIEGAGSRIVTRDFQDSRPALVGGVGDSALVLADRAVWTVDMSGRRAKVIDIPEGSVGRIWNMDQTPSSRATAGFAVEINSDDRKIILFVDPAGRTLAPVLAPTADAQVEAISLATRRVIFSSRDRNTDVATLSTPNGGQALLRLNEYLGNVESPTVVRLEYQSPAGRRLPAWLLLPPGYRPGTQRLPAVVDIYPGFGPYPHAMQVGGEAHPLGAVAPLLASHGYAVLMPSIPVGQPDFPTDRLQGITDYTLAAVDVAVAAGYIDDTRLAVQGISYGAYGAIGVVGRTNRFRTAVASAGKYDLISGYGNPRAGRRLEDALEGSDTSISVAWSETGQGDLGAPPWANLQRYVQYSPIFDVERINAPILLFHGDLDNTVSVTQSEEMFTALHRLNRDSLFVRYWGEGHRVATSPANVRDYFARLFDWYEQHLGAPFDRTASTSPQ